MQQQLVPTLEYPKSVSISLEQAILNQETQVVMSKRFARRICNQRSSIQFYTNNIVRCLGILFFKSARRQDHQFNTLTSALLSFKLVIYKSHNKPNQSIFLTVSPYRNTRSRSKTYKQAISICNYYISYITFPIKIRP